MCEYLKRMSPQDVPTDDIRWWSGQTHSVVEYTGPKPFGMDGSVRLWLHERSAAQLLDMCDELDAKFSDLEAENAKLRELVIALQHCRDGRCDGECPMFTPTDNNRGIPPVCEAYGVMRELGIEVDG